ncbi:hypothetical protein M5689_018872 [Euphorbia peplus]|nr:hypothetical protein M5689_018872 [Euphorbia peplus]
MAVSVSISISQLNKLSFFSSSTSSHTQTNKLISIRNPNPNPNPRSSSVLCLATRSPSGPLNKRSSSDTSKKKTTTKKKKSNKTSTSGLRDIEIVKDEDHVVQLHHFEDSTSTSKSTSLSFDPTTTPLPNPPAGFLLDQSGKVLVASNKRIATIVDPSNNCQLECIIRRVFTSTQGAECMLVCPLDTPVQILKSTNVDGWSAVSDEEVESILPAAAYALAKIHMHLVHSGFCYTARGGFCYSEDDIFDFRTDDGQDIEGLPTEGVEITCFHLDGAHYMIYTPSDPLLFVVVKDQNGQLQIADDDLLEDPAIISAIDEETEFNALVEEEAALLESLMDES